MTTATTATTTYAAHLMVWSDVGHCPITGRTGPYCDLLVGHKASYANPTEAREALARLVAATPHAYDGHYSMPEYPNQNTRTGWVKSRDRV